MYHHQMLKKKLEQKEAAENRAYLDLQLRQKELEEEAARLALAEDAKKQKRDLEIWNLEEAEKRCVSGPAAFEEKMKYRHLGNTGDA